MVINPSNVLKLLAMRFPGNQSTEDYSHLEEEIAQPPGLAVRRTTIPGDDQTVQGRIPRRTPPGRIRHYRDVLLSTPEFGRYR
ncbi:hypothetical protein L596_007614 [Steinernema carpocapsae]|uniref:Uncharacterized protein n=1 Tax=Steinernema carpocapsae TaxID=34508 RepID=A0A4U5P9X9_STECR|nr:hypothetical protein L596_007614 [Steinernema carpocapsae]